MLLHIQYSHAIHLHIYMYVKMILQMNYWHEFDLSLIQFAFLLIPPCSVIHWEKCYMYYASISIE